MITPQPGRRRSLNAELNLVPFIDLLSMCICFLLMTAVWVQIGALEVKQSRATQGQSNGPYELGVKFLGVSSAQLILKKNLKIDKKMVVKGDSPELFLAEMGTVLDQWVSKMPASSPISAAMVTPRKSVSYGQLVKVMDILRERQIVNLGVVPVEMEG